MEKNEKKPYELFFDQNVIEDEEDVLSICDLAKNEIFKRFNIGIKDSKLVACMYIIIFNTIHEKILEQEETKKSFRLNIADRLEIGFDTREDEEDEN